MDLSYRGIGVTCSDLCTRGRLRNAARSAQRKAVILRRALIVSAIVLAGAIPAEVIAQIRARLAGARFVPGRETAVGGAAVVKHNLQLARGEPAEERAVELLVGALQAHAQFQAATWPDGMMRPMFCRYLAG
jgi:predicted 2-oxoglutarate/Fe(II)-dependent dioxygenase YbiX